MWFLRGQTSDKSANTRNRRHVYFILDNRTFYLKEIMERMGEVIVVTFLDAIATADVLIANNIMRYQ